MPYFARQEMAAGGIYSTTADLLRYLQWHIDESNRVVKLTHQPTWGDIHYYAMGLNWQINDKVPMPRRIFQSEGTGGFSSYLTANPDQKKRIVLLINISDIDAGQRGVGVARAVNNQHCLLSLPHYIPVNSITN